MMQTNQKKNLEYYLSLPYTIELTPDDDGLWFAKIPLLEGCISSGYNEHDAIDMIQDAKRGWLMTALKRGIHIPEPLSDSFEHTLTAAVQAEVSQAKEYRIVHTAHTHAIVYRRFDSDSKTETLNLARDIS